MEEGGGEGGVGNAREDMLSLQPTHPVDTSASGNTHYIMPPTTLLKNGVRQ